MSGAHHLVDTSSKTQTSNMISEDGEVDDRFGSVLANLRRDNVASFASTVRNSGHASTKIKPQHTTAQLVECQLLPDMEGGSYHVVFCIDFTDELQWVLKIPFKGHSEGWNTSLAGSLNAEAQTMRLIRQQTTIPVPEVYAFDSTLDNVLGCPFILMEMLPGNPLYEGWFEHGASQVKLERFRARSLQSIAEAISQLDRFEFEEGGSLLFGANGEVAGIGPRRYADMNTAYENMCARVFDGMPFCDMGPFQDVKGSFLSQLNQRNTKRNTIKFARGANLLLRQLIDWSLTDTSISNKKPFVLAHPDFDTQNILVDEEGNVTGIIDWDWVAAVPRSVGFQKLPNFLVRDFDPQNYEYDVKNNNPPDEWIEHSPQELTCYRAMYAHFMENALSKSEREAMEISDEHAARVRNSRKDAADVTRRSLVMGTLETAANAPLLSLKMVIHIFKEIAKLTDEKWEPDAPDTCADSRTEYENDEEDDDDDDDDDPDDEKSLEALLDEIENLTASDNDYSEIMGFIAESKPNKYIASSDASTKAEPRGRRYGRHVCNWGQRKFQGAAKYLHRKEINPETAATQTSTSESRKLRATKALCGWTEKKLKRVVGVFHREGKLEDELMSQEDVDSAHAGGLRTLLDWFQKKLKSLYVLLRRRDKTNVEAFKFSASESSGKARKGAACRQFAAVLKETGSSLPPGQQMAFARWMIEIIKSEKDSEGITGVSAALLQRHREVSGFQDGQGAMIAPHNDGKDSPQLVNTAELDTQGTKHLSPGEGGKASDIAEYQAYSLGSDEEDDTTDSLSEGSSVGTSVAFELGGPLEGMDRCVEIQPFPENSIETIFSNDDQAKNGATYDFAEDAMSTDGSDEESTHATSMIIEPQRPWTTDGVATAVKGLSKFLSGKEAPKLEEKSFFNTTFTNHNHFANDFNHDVPLCEGYKDKNLIQDPLTTNAREAEERASRNEDGKCEIAQHNYAEGNDSGRYASENSEVNDKNEEDGMREDKSTGAGNRDTDRKSGGHRIAGTTTGITGALEMGHDKSPEQKDSGLFELPKLNQEPEEEKKDDWGRFTAYEVFNAFADGKLDEGRMQRLKEGFFMLLNQE